MKIIDFHDIKPGSITKPIQLLSAWLVGLIAIDGIFLHSAVLLKETDHVTLILTVASIINVPLFIWSLFTLQTKYRPEMQEDGYYSEYLKTGNKLGGTNINKNLEVYEQNTKLIEGINDRLDKITTAVTSDSFSNGKNELFEMSSDLKKIVTQSLLFSGVKVLLNKYIRDAENIEKILAQQNITISDYFGSETYKPPKELQITIGQGFSNKQLVELLTAVNQVSDGWIAYNPGEETPGQYDYEALIGSYGNRDGIRIDTALNYLAKGLSNKDFYEKIREEGR